MGRVIPSLQLALTAYRRADHGEAERLCREIIAAQQDNFGAYHLLALIEAGTARHHDALLSYAKALAIQPDDILALANRGNTLFALGRFGEALASYDRALATAPGYPDALSGRGAALHALDCHKEALAAFDKALSLQPTHPYALANRGKTLHDMRRFEEALASHDRALASRPDDPQFLCNRGATLHALGRYEAALTDYQRVLSLQPDRVDALSNQGATLRALGRLAAARASYDKALSIRADHPGCRFNRALLLLQTGSFRDGWREYEWRRKAGVCIARTFDAPEWQGDDPQGMRLLLYGEQGLGDTIQFARFARVLGARGAKVILEVQRPLEGLLQGLAGAREVVPNGERLPQVDLHLPLMSVPFVLGLEEHQIPAETPYLRADPGRTETWSKRLPEAGGEFRIGIAWQGNPGADIDRGRSIPLASFAPLARIPGVRLVSLQKHDGLDQLRNLPPGMRVDTLGEDFDAEPDGFLDSAAVMMHLDLVVTSDSAIAHLAGALGRPVCIVLQAVPDWRWMMDRADTPWYPTARLFRQSRRGDWDEVFARVAGTLLPLVQAKQTGAKR
jgi:tetratricopeptide (TPR) repeat protein